MNQIVTHSISPAYTGHLMHRLNTVITYPALPTAHNETIIEIGPGRGDFLFHLADIHPDKSVFGIEIQDKRFNKLVHRRDNRQLHNIQLVLADAAVALPELFGDSSADAIYINFPDPWPKKKHVKKRLLKKAFLEICTRSLRPGGTLFITTDVDWYARDVFDICRSIPELAPVFPDVQTHSDEAYPTLFAQKWENEGRTIYYQKHLKKS